MQGRHMYRRVWRIVGLLTLSALLPMAAWAHEIGAEADEALARGLNVSIFFLLAMPLVIFGVIFGTVYVAQKRAQTQARKGPDETQKAPAP
jgi:heme/copper-type cytochrome/quinol oxidase subunit 2